MPARSGVRSANQVRALATLSAAEVKSLIAHRSRRQRVDDCLRRTAAHRGERRRARVVAVVARAALRIEEALAVGWLAGAGAKQSRAERGSHGGRGAHRDRATKRGRSF